MKILRNLNDLTLTQLAELADIDRATVTRLEHGKSRPQRRTARKLASVLGVEPTVLFPEMETSGE